MGYNFNSAQLRSINNQLTIASNTLGGAIQDAFAAIDSVARSDAMKGQGATTIQNYLVQVHQTCICAPLMETLYALQRGFAAYYAQYLLMEPSVIDAVINTDELETIKEFLKSALAQLELAEAEMNSVMKQVEDISTQKYNGLGASIPLKIESIRKHLSDVTNQIGEIESKECNDVQNIQDTIDSISRIIYQYCTNGFEISAYNTQSLVASNAFASLCTSMSALGTFNSKLEEQSEQVDGLLTNIEQQWKEREETAQKLQLGLGVLKTVTFAIAIGVSGPIGAAVVCGIAGGLHSALSERLDQWSSGEQAMRGGYNVGDIMWETSIGTLKGVVKGFTGATFAKLSSSSTFLGKLGTNIAKNFSTEMLETPFELIDSAYDGNLTEKWEEISSDEYSLELAGKCTVESLLDTTISDSLDKWGDNISRNADTKLTKGIFNTVWNTTSNVVTQRIEDTSEKFIEALIPAECDSGLKWGEAVSAGRQEFLDFSDIGEQVISAGIKNVAVEVYDNTSLFDEVVVKTHEHAVNEKIKIDPEMQNAEGPIYTHYELTVGGPEFSNVATNPNRVFVLDHSDPISQRAREIYRTEGERVEKDIKTIVKGAAKGLSELVTADEVTSYMPKAQKRLAPKCLDNIIALKK